MEKKRILGILTLILGLLFSPLYAQERDVKVYLESDSLSLGDQVILWVEARYPREEVLEWPDVVRTIPDQFEVLNQGGLDTLPEGLSYVHYRQKILLGCYKDGAFEWKLPLFVFSNRGGAYFDSLAAPSIVGEVTAPDVDLEAPFRDIMGSIDPPRHWREFVWEVLLLFALLVFAGISFLVYRYVKRRPVQLPAETPEVFLPPHVVALKELEVLAQGSLLANPDRRPYYTELTRILRAYLEGRFRIDAEEMSSTEIKQAYALVCTSAPSEVYLYQILKAADLVKFAKARPSEDQARAALADARSFVELTALSNPTGA